MINCYSWTEQNEHEDSAPASEARQSQKSRRGRNRDSSKAQSMLPSAADSAQSTTHGRVTESSASLDGDAPSGSMHQEAANAAPPNDPTVTIETATQQTTILPTSYSSVESVTCSKTADSPSSPLILPPGIKTYYNHAGIVIIHGDCRDVMPWLPKVDLVCTDPPYGAGYAANPILGKNRASAPHVPQVWDRDRFSDISAVIAAGRWAIIWGGNYYELPPSRCWLVWHKPDALPSMAQLEMAWVSRDGNAKHMSWTTAATNEERVGHPTQKPEAVMRWAINQFPEARTVIDPFVGSGTTLVAAKNLGKSAIGIEIEERYCELSAKRLSQEVFQF